ncbi:hypothetical protein IFM89_015244 [Coptis chinensis]|uniref:DUF4283 domain-containing protein n=1 Tax=Coptis chinensis TaxID=261450 RepID=A0A835LIP7_9MAGN|nr:hypothetical protein IFM89_015244 [Coptis chinensis]
MVTTILVWVKCHNVPKELWTDDGLGFVASKVGIPFSQDEATKQKKRIDYARLCIEEGRQNERITPNANVSYENAMRNTIMYAGNGSGEDVNRRIWRVRSHPNALSDSAGTSCIRNDRGKEIPEQPTSTTVQHEPNSQSSGAQGNGTEIEELNTGVHETRNDPSIGF